MAKNPTTIHAPTYEALRDKLMAMKRPGTYTVYRGRVWTATTGNMKHGEDVGFLRTDRHGLTREHTWFIFNSDLPTFSAYFCRRRDQAALHRFAKLCGAVARLPPLHRPLDFSSDPLDAGHHAPEVSDRPIDLEPNVPRGTFQYDTTRFTLIEIDERDPWTKEKEKNQ